jgi:hypothetical protein
MPFITDLEMKEIGEMNGRSVYVLLSALVYFSEMGKRYTVPAGFQSDLASVPRLPVLYGIWGDRAHREALLHDFLYRKDSDPVVSFGEANGLFLEAMGSRGVKTFIRFPMYAGVALGGIFSYHKLKTGHQFFETIDPIQ